VSLGSWDSVTTAFRDAEKLVLHELCADQPSSDFRPSWVRTGWREGELWVYAELEDEDIFNPVQEFNAPFFLNGDVFEIFLKPAEQAAYCEFHVGPTNQKLQLRIPSAEDFLNPNRERPFPATWCIHSPVIESRVRICPSENRWYVVAIIPYPLVDATGMPQAGASWSFSFCRYDCARGNPTPVCSTTSPHTQRNFHRQQEWGTLVFTRGDR
jgi:hypothetical protein